MIIEWPLYKIAKRGLKEDIYCYSDEELQQKLDEVGRENTTVQRYKGLGEMNAEQLWETTMNPEKRTLIQITMEDAIEADKLFNQLMGEDPELRRQFIEENATLVSDLDV